MGYQFIHIESYARQAGKGKDGENNLSKVAGEADRLEGNTKHLPTPQPPKILYGVSASKVAEMAEDWADEAKDSRGHKLRKDGLCLVAGVISVPNDFKDWESFKKSSFRWLKNKYGSRLKSIVEHTDEPHRHIHFYVVPKAGERFEDIHQGKKASTELKGQPKGIQNAAYIEAMRIYQDEFSKEVAMNAGLTKLGPGRRRLTRAAWQAETSQAAFFASSKAQHREARKKGYKDGYEAGRLKARQVTESVGVKAGTVLAAVGKAVFSRWHAPTQEALAESEKYQKKAKQEADNALRIEIEAQNKIKNLINDHQKEVDRLKRIASNADIDANRALKKLEELKLLEPQNKKNLKKDF